MFPIYHLVKEEPFCRSTWSGCRTVLSFQNGLHSRAVLPFIIQIKYSAYN